MNKKPNIKFWEVERPRIILFGNKDSDKSTIARALIGERVYEDFTKSPTSLKVETSYASKPLTYDVYDFPDLSNADFLETYSNQITQALSSNNFVSILFVISANADSNQMKNYISEAVATFNKILKKIFTLLKSNKLQDLNELYIKYHVIFNRYAQNTVFNTDSLRKLFLMRFKTEGDFSLNEDVAVPNSTLQEAKSSKPFVHVDFHYTNPQKNYDLNVQLELSKICRRNLVSHPVVEGILAKYKAYSKASHCLIFDCKTQICYFKDEHISFLSGSGSQASSDNIFYKEGQYFLELFKNQQLKEGKPKEFKARHLVPGHDNTFLFVARLFESCCVVSLHRSTDYRESEAQGQDFVGNPIGDADKETSTDILATVIGMCDTLALCVKGADALGRALVKYFAGPATPVRPEDA